MNDAVVYDVDKDGRQEIILGCNDSPGLYLLNHDGTIRWKNGEVSNSRNVGGGDINGDGSIEVIATSDAGKISTFNAKGKLLDSFDPGFYAAFLSLGKFIAKNKGLEIITSRAEEEKEFLNILDSKGNPVWKFPLGKAVEARPAQTSCCLARGWLAVGTRDGQIFVFDSKGKVIAYSKDSGKQILVTWTKNEKGEWLLISAVWKQA